MADKNNSEFNKMVNVLKAKEIGTEKIAAAYKEYKSNIERLGGKEFFSAEDFVTNGIYNLWLDDSQAGKTGRKGLVDKIKSLRDEPTSRTKGIMQQAKTAGLTNKELSPMLDEQARYYYQK